MGRRRSRLMVLSLVALSLAGVTGVTGVREKTARAGAEVLSYDVRTAAMGGAGVSGSRGAAAVVDNPALILTTDSVDLTLNSFVLNAQTEAPVLGPNQPLNSSITVPVFFAAGALRLNRKLAVAVGVEPIGAGAPYDLPNGGKLSVIAVQVSLELSAAYAITDNLYIGAAWRPSYVKTTIRTPSPTPTDPGAETKLDLSHVAPASGSVGLFCRIDSDTRAGLFYRSRTSTDLTGSAITPGGTFDARSHFALPDKFVLGFDRSLFDKRLSVAVQGEVELFGALDGTQITTVETPGGPIMQRTVSNDKTTWGVKVGGELWAIPDRLAVRAGLWFGTEPGREEHANYFSPYFNYMFFPTAGIGVKLGRLDLNAVMSWEIRNGAQVAQTDNGNPGHYAHWAYLPGVSANARF